MNWSSDSAVGIVMAAGEYPASSSHGETITGLNEAATAGAKVFHAGTSVDSSGNTVTAGGRVLCVTARGSSVSEAKEIATNAANKITWPNAHWRRDIAYRAIARES